MENWPRASALRTHDNIAQHRNHAGTLYAARKILTSDTSATTLRDHTHLPMQNHRNVLQSNTNLKCLCDYYKNVKEAYIIWDVFLLLKLYQNSFYNDLPQSLQHKVDMRSQDVATSMFISDIHPIFHWSV
jgi:hypothetical protein